jgi:hypothetical protein
LVHFDGGGHMPFIVMCRDLPSEHHVTDERISTELMVYLGTYELKGKNHDDQYPGSSQADFTDRTATRVIKILSPNQIGPSAVWQAADEGKVWSSTALAPCPSTG